MKVPDKTLRDWLKCELCNFSTNSEFAAIEHLREKHKDVLEKILSEDITLDEGVQILKDLRVAILDAIDEVDLTLEIIEEMRLEEKAHLLDEVVWLLRQNSKFIVNLEGG